MKRSLTRQERLRNSRDIKGMFSAGRRVESRGMKLLFKTNRSSVTRFAVVVARGCGGSVRRNREKRITREAFRSLKEGIRPGADVVFLVTRFGEPYADRRAAMMRLLGRAGLRADAD
jgi:ribonuclease P protein component